MIATLWARWKEGRLTRVVGITAVAVVWGVLLLGVAVPSWRKVERQHGEIQALERQLADLDRWILAGLWLEPVVVAQEPVITAEWDRRFPRDRDREALFLAMARLADHCRLRGFQLEEIQETGTFDMGTWSTTDDALAAIDAPPAGAPMPAPVTITLDPYRLQCRFIADFTRAAAYLGGLERLDRVVDVRRLAIRPDRDGIEVELELEVPVSET